MTRFVNITNTIIVKNVEALIRSKIRMKLNKYKFIKDI